MYQFTSKIGLKMAKKVLVMIHDNLDPTSPFPHGTRALALPPKSQTADRLTEAASCFSLEVDFWQCHFPSFQASNFPLST